MDNVIHPKIDLEGKCYDGEKVIYSCVLNEEKNYINGYTEDGTCARYFFNKGRWYYGSGIGAANIIPVTERSPEEQAEIRRRSGEAMKRRAEREESLNDMAKRMLKVEMSDKNIDEILGTARELIGEEKTAAAVMIAKMIQTACAGSFKAAEFVRDTAGYKPKDSVEISADIITEEDRSLIDKINKRLTG